ncbi:hypothetical protein LOD99_443 [Oopsacas minuta]|uniref:tRNA-splicing endonuclease subunit Sen15 domain-containing protein n=1 Tax=Oopsacas minuta TaxID=111878 RepID=A0AAV7KAR6_9METZ|nr:hypothetical protein LOD99_443 [Oopsacas minuta]
MQRKEHPITIRLEYLGVEDKYTREMILLVFNDLFDVKIWPELRLILHPDESKPPLLAGRPSADGPITLVQPRPSERLISLQSLYSELSLIQKKYSANSIMVAFVDSDSAIVYYNLNATDVPSSYKSCPKQQTLPNIA